MIRSTGLRMMKRTRGFLLAEAIFSVFITVIIVLILQNLMQNLRNAQKIGHKTDEVAYAYVQFDRFLHDDGESYTMPDKSHSSKAVFKHVNSRGKEESYSLEFYVKNGNKMLRTSTSSGGHMPLLVNLKDAKLKTDDEHIEIDLMEKDGRRSVLTFRLNKKAKKAEKDSTKESDNKTEGDNEDEETEEDEG